MRGPDVSELLEADVAAERRYQELLSLGEGASIEALISALRDANWRVRRLAADRLAHETPTPQLLSALTDLLGERDQTGARNAAVSVLSQMGARAVPNMVGLLAHPDPDQRKLAADILGALHQPTAVPALLTALSDADGNVRASAAEALGQIGGEAATRALERLLSSDEPLLRVCALEGLGHLGRPPPLPMVAAMLHDDDTRRSAYRLLGQIEHPTAFALLCRGLSTPARDAALAGLGARTSGWSSEAESTLKVALQGIADADKWLKHALGSADRLARVGAMHAVVASRRHALAPQVAAAAEGGELAEPASWALNRFGLPGALALLHGDPQAIVLLADEARAVAAELLTRVGEPVMVPLLEQLMLAGDGELAEVAVRALGRTRTPAAVKALLMALDDEALASAASRGLLRIAASFPTEVAGALAASLSGHPRPHALRAYAQVAPSMAQAEVRSASRHASESLRAAAAEAAVSLPAEVAAELLGRALLDEAGSVRRAAAKGLPSLGAKVAEPLLERALTDIDASVLSASCEAAAELNAAASLARLEALAGHASAAVSMAALQALSSLGVLTDAAVAKACRHTDVEVVKSALQLAADRPEGPAVALGLLTHTRWDVRIAAARVLQVAGGRAVLGPLEQAMRNESDAMAREVMAVAVERVRGS